MNTYKSGESILEQHGARIKTARLLAATIFVAAATAVSTALAQQTYEPYAITTLAGLTFTGGSSDGTGSAARFLSPAGVALDNAGNIYVADSGNHTIRKVTAGGVVSTVAGLAGSAGSVDGTGSAARFYQPEGVAVDSAGNIFVADSLSHIIRKITSGGVVTLFAGTRDFPGSADGIGSAAQFFAPKGIAVDSAGNIFVADTYNSTIRKITSGGVVTTLAGLAGSAGSADGTGSAARFNYPESVAVDSAGNIDVADTANYTIRRITSGGVVTTLAGLANTSGSADGTGSAARFANPDGVAVDGAGNVYVADSSNRTLRKITFDGEVTTLAGSVGGNQAADGIGILAQFGLPYGVAASSTGAIAVGDYGAQTIRVGRSVGPLAPPHGGLSVTLFTVNGSTSSTANVADTVLRFAVQQTGRPAGLRVRVQSSPDDGITWNELSDGTENHMTYDVSSDRFILNTTGYPLQNHVSFRAISEGQRYPDSISNVVKFFDLVSPTGRTHLGPIVLTGTAGGMIADIHFRVKQLTLPPDVALRVQSSATPADELSWTDLSDGNAGHMQQSDEGFFLLATILPAAESVYFRAVATLDGDVDSLSGAIGPVKLTHDTPPAVTVTITPHTPSYILSGDGTILHPFVIAAGTFNFGATVTVPNDRQVRSLALQVDGDTIASFGQGAGSGRTDYGTTWLRNHVVLEALAIDDLGATSRAGTGAIYVNIVAPGGANGANGSGPDSSIGPKVFAVANSGGLWTDPATWVSAGGVHGVPGPEDLAVVGDSSVRFDLDADVGSVAITGGHLVGPGNLSVHHTFTMTAGTFENYIGLFIEPGATCNLLNSDVLHLAGKIYNQGTINLHGASGLDRVILFQNDGGVAFKYPLSLPLNAGVNAAAASRIIAAQTVTSSGIIHGLLPERLISPDGAGIVAAGGGVVSHDGASVVSHDGASLVTASGGTLVASGAGNLVATGAGNLVATGAGNLVATGAGNRPAGAAPSFTQTGGEIDLNAVGIVGPVTLDGGVLSGSGMIDGDLANTGGFIAAEHLAVTGNFTQGANGTLIVRNGGALPNQFDQLQIGGTANLGGTLHLKTINGYTPDIADTFSPLGASSVSGVFASVSANAGVTTGNGGVLLTDDITQLEAGTGQPLNISTRMKVLSGDNVLICGFIVTGPGGSTKKVLIRGMGPSLAQLGVPGTLSDPLLELHQPDGSVVMNDNWADAPNAGEIPPGFEPGDPNESIVIATLSPGSYTAIVKGAHGETGVGLAEVYDLDPSSSGKLANVSTRGFIDTGDNVMIGGFIVGGTEPARILVRAIGPSLTDAGVEGALADPVLELHDANGSSFNNDNWRETQENEIIATTIPPSNEREPAILVTLVPGSYTAVVRGKDDTTGIGLVEAYNLH